MKLPHILLLISVVVSGCAVPIAPAPPSQPPDAPAQFQLRCFDIHTFELCAWTPSTESGPNPRICTCIVEA